MFMRSRITLLLLGVCTLAFARPQQRQVVIDTVCHAPTERMLEVVEKFCYQFQSNPDSLFTWAYVGLGEAEIKESKSKEGRDAVQLRYKDRFYDPVEKNGDVAIDIYVLGIRWWKNQHLGTHYRLTRPSEKPYPLNAHMTATYSGSILEGGDVIFLLEPLSPTETAVHYEFRLVFGRFLSAFISDKTWRNAMEWRFKTILENLVEYAETGTVTEKERGPVK